MICVKNPNKHASPRDTGLPMKSESPMLRKKSTSI